MNQSNMRKRRGESHQGLSKKVKEGEGDEVLFAREGRKEQPRSSSSESAPVAPILNKEEEEVWSLVKNKKIRYVKPGTLDKNGEIIRSAGSYIRQFVRLEPLLVRGVDSRLLWKIEDRRYDQKHIDRGFNLPYSDYSIKLGLIQLYTELPFDVLTMKVKEGKASTRLEHFGDKIVKGKYFVEDDQTHMENAILDLISFVWRPQVIDELNIVIPHEASIEPTFDLMLKMFELAQIRRVKCENLTLLMKHAPSSLPQFLKFFKPGTFCALTLRTENTDMELMRSIVGSRQWMNLKNFTCNLFSIAMSGPVNFELFETMCEKAIQMQNSTFLKNNLWNIIQEFHHLPFLKYIGIPLPELTEAAEQKARQQSLLAILSPSDQIFPDQRRDAERCLTRIYRNPSNETQYILVEFRKDGISLRWEVLDDDESESED